MKYKLIKQPNVKYNVATQILTNRGVPEAEVDHYLHTTDNDINDFSLFGLSALKEAAAALFYTIKDNKPCFLCVDCDCDGYTSAAILINYLHDIFPAWVENNMIWYMHEDKTHGLSDCIDYILNSDKDFKLVITPDSSSNNYEETKKLKLNGITTIVLDHHLADEIDPNVIMINNQLSDYPNKEFSGAGVTWQFCRYLDSLLQKDFANNYLDLVALGNLADMVSCLSIETKHIIHKGLNNINNPFIHYMWQKNEFKLGQHLTYMGVAFYIAPFVNAVTRSGTIEEKRLCFEAMLKHRAFLELPSTKRGHKPGDTELLVEQAIRVLTNVKNRQQKAVDVGMELLENMIKSQNLMKDKVLLFMLGQGEIDKNIAGLCANKIMAKYQRSTCVLTYTERYTNKAITNLLEDLAETIISLYVGSARGYTGGGTESFKDICDATGCVDFTAGHDNAFGIGIRVKDLSTFIERTNELLKNESDEPVYYVDYIYNGLHINPQDILDIASLADVWGQDVRESLVAIEHLKITKDMVTLMSPDKNPTIKITLPCGVSLLKFKSSQEEYEKFLADGAIDVDIVGTCNINEWNGNITPQIFIEDYNITKAMKYFF